MKRDIEWWLVIALCILIAGILLTFWSAQQQDLALRTDLLQNAGIAKTAVSPAQVASLSGTAADISSPEYLALKGQLEKIRASDPACRFAYLMGQREDGTIILYADSEVPESPDYSPPGQEYTEAPAVIRTMFADRQKVTYGPYTDRWGTWVSGFVPVTDPAIGRVIAVYGMDINAQNWNTALFRASLPTLIAILFMVLLVLVSASSHRRSEEERRRLTESEEKFSEAFHANPALMTISTIDDGRILDANTSFLTTLGYSREEVIGRTTTDLGLYGDPACRDTIIRRIKETGEVHNSEVKIHRKNRDLIDGSLSAVFIDIAGTPRLFTVTLDITERTRAEEALHQANKKLSLLSSVTRHDINNQLTVLQNYLVIAGNDLDDPSHQQYFRKLETAAQCISAMIRFTEEYESVGVIAPAWHTCRTLVDTAAKQAVLGRVMVKNDLPAGAEVFADPLIVKVFYNLMDNAVRYGGKITNIQFSLEERDGSHIMVCEDDGNGVAADEKKKIFERGFGKNTGFGLALSREILDITGITIQETGGPGNGARFEITIPKGAYRIAAD